MELVALGTTTALAARTTVVVASERCARTADSRAVALAAIGTWSLPTLLANRSYRVASRFAAATTVAWLIWGWTSLAQIDQT